MRTSGLTTRGEVTEPVVTFAQQHGSRQSQELCRDSLHGLVLQSRHDQTSLELGFGTHHLQSHLVSLLVRPHGVDVATDHTQHTSALLAVEATVAVLLTSMAGHGHLDVSTNRVARVVLAAAFVEGTLNTQSAVALDTTQVEFREVASAGDQVGGGRQNDVLHEATHQVLVFVLEVTVQNLCIGIDHAEARIGFLDDLHDFSHVVTIDGLASGDLDFVLNAASGFNLGHDRIAGAFDDHSVDGDCITDLFVGGSHNDAREANTGALGSVECQQADFEDRVELALFDLLLDVFLEDSQGLVQSFIGFATGQTEAVAHVAEGKRRLRRSCLLCLCLVHNGSLGVHVSARQLGLKCVDLGVIRDSHFAVSFCCRFI